MQFSSSLIALTPLLSSIVTAIPVSDASSISNLEARELTKTNCHTFIEARSFNRANAWAAQDSLNKWKNPINFDASKQDNTITDLFLTQLGSTACCQPIVPYKDVLIRLCQITCGGTKFKISGPALANYAAGIINTCAKNAPTLRGGDQRTNEDYNTYVEVIKN